MRKLITLLAIIVPFLVSCKHEVYYEITTKVQPDGTGSIVVSPSSDQVQEGATVSFTAKPNGEYAFTGWSGSLSGTENPKTVTASSNLNVVAIFTLRSYPLTITVEGEGSVAEKIISTKADYTSGTIVELTAQAADHWSFDHWEGDLKENTNPAQITVTSSKSVKAVFVKKMYDLTVTVEGEGAVGEKVVETKGSYQEGTLVELTATPNTYWAFDRWEGDITGTDNPVLITISDAASVKAVFVEHDPGIQYTETEFIDPQQVKNWLGFGLNLCWHLCAFTSDAAHAYIPEWVNETSLDEMMDKVVSMGVKTVRLQTTFCGELGPSPSFKINESWMEKIKMYVDCCEKHGLNVILNQMHEQGGQSLYPNKLYAVDFLGAASNPEVYQYEASRFTEVWRQLSREFRDKGDFLIFEPFNEPTVYNSYGKDLTGAIRVVNEFNQLFVDTVRSTGGNNARRWLSIVSWECNNPEMIPTFLEMPVDYVSNNRFIVPFHYYGGLFNDEDWTEWGHTATLTTPDIWNHDEEYVKGIFSQMKRTYIDQGIPVVLGETGCFNGENDRQFAYELYYLEYIFRCASLHLMPAMLHTMDGPRYYEYSSEIQSMEGNYGFYDFERKYYRPHGKEIEALINKAFYSTDSDYTLEYIYQNAPYQDEVPGGNVEFGDETLKTYLLSHFDRDGNGMLSYSEVMKISLLNLSNLGLKSIPDIGKFPALSDLTCCGTEESLNVLESLNVSNNKELRNLNVECANLRDLILSNSKLTSLTCRSNHLTILDLSKTPNITFLRCFDNPVTDLNVTCLSQLEWIDCCGMLITSLDLSGNPKLKELRCHTNCLLSLDLSQNPELTYIDCYSTQITALDVSNNPKLEALHAWDCPNLSVIYLKTGQTIPDLQKDDHTRIEYK